MAWAIAVALSAALAPVSHAQQAFSSAWFAERGAAQGGAAQTGLMPNGVPIQFQLPVQQQQAAQRQLQQSIDNLGNAAQAIALQQRLQEQARQAHRDAGFVVADGLGKGGLQVDGNLLTKGWINAREAVQSTGSDGRVQVSIEQTADKSILNWETFNIGGNTTLSFLQNPDWAVLNRVNDPNALPSQLLGQLKATGSVFVVNPNGVIFGNNSQVNVRNLAAAAARISDNQFRNGGLYGADANSATFTDAVGKVMVEQGARISTHEPSTATRGGGYVLLAGHTVENAGQIETRKGQAQLAAGDSFVIRRGMGTAENTASTTRGNEIAPRFTADSTAGVVRNTGLIRAREGDITLAGRDVQQAGVAVASTTINQRGTVHLLNSASDAKGSVTLAEGSTTAVLIEDDGNSTALDGQRAALIKESAEQDNLRAASNRGSFDNLSRLQDRRDQSRVEIVSGGDINFDKGSLAVATGGQVVADAKRRSYVGDGARVDVAGAVGVNVSMESNNVQVNVQGNELRDSPDNRDSGKLVNNRLWIDRRQLVNMPAGTGGYAGERWYAAGGLLEVSGYLDNQGHSIGEWAAQGGTVQLAGNEVVSHAGSRINLSGGSLDVRSGVIQQSWLRGNDGQLYRLDKAPAQMLFAGVYQGYEVKQERWGTTDAFRNPIIAATQRTENGYTVGRDAGQLVISAPTAVLEGQVATQTFQGAQQVRRPDQARDGYGQAQTAVARNAQLWLGNYSNTGRAAAFDSDVRLLTTEKPSTIDWTLQTPVEESRRNTVWLDTQRLSEQQWGRLDLATTGRIELDGNLRLQDGAQVNFIGSNVRLGGTLQIAGGQLQASNLLTIGTTTTALTKDGRGQLEIAEGARINLAGGWNNALVTPQAVAGQAWIDGGSLRVESSHDVTVGKGSQVNVDAGGAMDINGKGRIGKGGSVSLLANSGGVTTDGSGRVQLAQDAGFSARGGGTSGSFTLASGGQIRIGGDAGAGDALTLQTGLFNNGFSKYDINGHQGVSVAPGTQLQVGMPVLRLAETAYNSSDRNAALEAWLAPLYAADPISGRISQRAGASLALRSERLAVGGDLRVGKGALIAVDPGQAIDLRGGGNMRVEGTLRAQGGRIGIDDVRAEDALYSGKRVDRSWRIADGAVLDVSGDAVSLADAGGRLQGLVRKGGQIEIGGALDWEEQDQIRNRPPEAFVVIERGAQLHANGASGQLDIQGKGRTQVDSDGGSIVLRSADALYLLGDMQARAGGAGARGGTLGIAFGGSIYAPRTPDDAEVRTSRAITLSQQTPADQSIPERLAYGHAALSVAQIQQGGFDNLSVFGDMRATGDIDLRMGQSLRVHGLSATALGMAAGAAAGSSLQLSAPYLRFAQGRWLQLPSGTLEQPTTLDVPLDMDNGHRFTANADLIDIRDKTWLRSFDDVQLRSSGDIRFLNIVTGVSGESSALVAQRSMDVMAAQLYPVASAKGYLGAGTQSSSSSSYNDYWRNPEGILRIHGTGGATPAAPHSAFGSLSLVAATVEQGGVVRAPWGRLELGGNSDGKSSRVLLQPGSLTSTSGEGLRLPYGGTVDGISWQFDGRGFDPLPLGGNAGLRFGVTLTANEVKVANGATLDLSGGGELTGAAFVMGRGGSVDIRRTALANANPGYGFSSSGNAVYAIVPGYQGMVAPAGLADGSADPALGQRIQVPEGVPGLAAGTYTLLPASYALQPGAFRVELGGSGTAGVVAPTATGTGSWRVAGQQVQGLGGATSPLLTELLLTPAAVVRQHSGYNETSYNAFAQADAQRRGMPVGWQTADAATLALQLGAGAGRDGSKALDVQGTARFQAAAGSNGAGGMLTVQRGLGLGSSLEIVNAGQASALKDTGATVEAEALNALRPSRLVLGGSAAVGADSMGVNAVNSAIVVRSGVTLRAPEVVLTASKGGSGILVEAGAAISTLGMGAAPTPDEAGYRYTTTGGMLSVSNGRALTMLQTSTSDLQSNNVNIDVGGCLLNCSGEPRLLSEGSIGIATNGSVELRDNLSYGTRQLGLSMSAINLGTAQAIAEAGAAGALPKGMLLNQTVLGQLLRGNTATGAPALDTLSLAAQNAINVFGSVDLDTRDAATGRSSLRSLVIGTPAIHGYGAQGDRARIFADALVWDGTLAANQLVGSSATVGAGEAMVNRLGSGQLDIITRTLELGRAPFTQPNSEVPANRQVLGFAGVNLTAAERLLFSGKGGLDVFQTQGSYVAGKGWQYSGGALDINTPLLTGNAGAQLDVRTGGLLRLHGAGADTGSDALGAQLKLDAAQIDLDSRIALASGRLEANARQGITLGDKAVLDLAGRKVKLNDVDKYSWGGDVLLTAAEGDITTHANSRVDLSASNNRGGRLSVTALGKQGGRVDLAGSILGGASGRYDAGGTVVPYDAGELVLRARQLQDFSGLNQRLTTGGVTGGRSFRLTEGDLVIGDEMKARNVDISVDGGSLQVSGRIDASGEQVGSIRLSARDQLRVDGALDAHGTGLRVDSYGKIIDSPNRANVELASAGGGMVLGSTASIDLRAGTGVANGTRPGQNDGRARGSFKINVPRIGTDDAAIDVANGLSVSGAADLQLNAYRSYDNAPQASTPDVYGNRPQLVTQQWFDQTVDPDNRNWMNAALANTDLQQRTSALGKYRLRPGVQILARASDSNPRGDLTVLGDLDLSGYRYGPDANRTDPARRGFGESAALVLRAEGDLNIYGSINDGFAPPPANPDEAGWVLTEGPRSGFDTTAFGGAVVVPTDGVQLQPGTQFAAGATLNYALPFRAATLPAGTVLPAEMTLSGSLTLPAGSVLGATVTTQDGKALAAGTVLAEAVNLGAGSRLGAGFRLHSNAAVSAQTWPAGVPLPVAMQLSTTLDLRAGAVIPSMTKVELPGDKPVQLRPAGADGRQGRNWALAQMLPEGTTSWDIAAVAGADGGAADPRTLGVDAQGSLVLADTHYGAILKGTTTFKGGRVLTAAGASALRNPSLEGMSVDEVAALTGRPVTIVCRFARYCEPAPRFLSDEGALAWFGDAAYANRKITELVAETGFTEAQMCEVASYCYGGGTTETTYTRRLGTPAWSVLRTGKGDIDLLAANDVRMRSAFGVYTAGAPTALDGEHDAGFQQPRAPAPWNNTLLGALQGSGDYDAALAAYRAWYPDQGGNLRVQAGRDILGDVWTAVSEFGNTEADKADHASAAVGNWLWRQGTGTTSGVDATPSAWWVNFGTYSFVRQGSDKTPRMVGFTGFGTLGGGNLSMEAGRHAGVVDAMGQALSGSPLGPHSSAVVAAVGSSGRVNQGELHLTGGGDLALRSGGGINPGLQATSQNRNGANEQNLDLNGALINLRGNIRIDAARIGGLSYEFADYADLVNGLRRADPFVATTAKPMGGPVLVLGDSTAQLQARGDVVLGGVADAGRVPMANYASVTLNDGSRAAGTSWFSLWTANTAVDLFSAGGDLSPLLLGGSNMWGDNVNMNVLPHVEYWLYPSRFSMVAASGDIKLQNLQKVGAGAFTQNVLLLAPSASGRLDMLANGSIYAETGGTQISRSGADTRIPTPFDPAFMAQKLEKSGELKTVRNTSEDGITSSPESSLSLFAFGPNTPRSGALASLPMSPSRFYAVNGDIINLTTGGNRELNRSGPNTSRTLFNWYEAAAPVRMMAGQDILSSNVYALNTTGSDVTLVQAGRDIVQTNVTVAGPGNVEVTAGRQLRQEDKASVVSLGGAVQGDTRPGASVALTAGNQQLRYDALRKLYLDPANKADASQPLASQPGKVVKVYDEELKQWLKQRFDYSGNSTDALSYFDALPAEQQRIFLRQVYYAELREGGREYNNPDSPRFTSYLRGRNAIATFAPEKDEAGQLIDRTGDIVMYGGAGVHTLFGGNIELMAPGGQIVVGVQGEVPPASAGLVTHGQGDIRLFSQGSVLLGLSRMMTTFGGDILAWSVKGDINAGRGSQTTLLYTPPRRLYDMWGNVSLAPQAPSSGAGIATLNPIPEVPPGDVDLIAPLGTIDAGEAGIRVSGNINLAALQVLNAANIQVQGESKGLPVLATVNVNALASASAAANSATQAAQDVMRKTQDDARRNQPSVISVQVLGFGEPTSSLLPNTRKQQTFGNYDPDSAFQFPQASEPSAQLATDRRQQQ